MFVLLWPHSGCKAETIPGTKKPNIVIYLSDDHGYDDSGVYGDAQIQTPHMDRLAEEGLTFTRAFAATPLCSPSRCVIETGLMPFRNGAHKFGTPIRLDIKTMPEYFKELGYYTAEIGKFHHGPNHRFPYDFIERDENVAETFIREYTGDKPLFLMVCSHPPHTPWVKNTVYGPDEIVLPPNYIDTPETREERTNYYSDVTLMDSILGNVYRALEEREMLDNSLFIYTTDQGANWPFGKWTLYDAGLRVPFIARWPGEIEPGSETDAMIDLSDLLPTCIDVAGGEAVESLDGRTIMGVLKGKTNQHREVVFGTHTGNDNGGPGIWNHCPTRMIRTDQYKYILNLEPDTTFTTHITGSPVESIHYLSFWETWVEEAGTDERAYQIVNKYLHRPLEELYDLHADPYEMFNLVNDPQYHDLLASLKKQLARWRKAQGDTISVNAYYNYQVN
ncbi:MAG: sulfatase [Bacteroidetes bacterium]|nr:sulfatase [Bacteroidota bacterium]